MSRVLAFLSELQQATDVSGLVYSIDYLSASRSASTSSTKSDFDWTTIIDWPSSPETVSKQPPARISIEHYTSPSNQPALLTQDRIHRQRELKKDYNHRYYQIHRSDPQLWRKKLDNQKLYRIVKSKREKSELAKLSKEDREAIMRRKNQNRREQYLKNTIKLKQQGKKRNRTNRLVRDLSPETREKRRAKNQKAVQKYREKQKEQARNQQDDHTTQ
ncbi:uncharacterized protein FA14DRAFT_155662 [Meira miltonrushii]|uniref:Uncharacterized protein n=1 Tax=Meira miltonrushii TaxID=1280837 RepID=A0A316VF47_9BASI|nr:uncharacterized protein FA14DRAFT_155662 [Meira miltonrushii]PWN36257.1 hypothetical protein FA14DRAFT_155662 [Meira miltonrushii]